MERITVKTSVNAELAKVWEFWIIPKHITNWNFATDEWCCPKAINNLNEGDVFNWRMESKDGKIGFDFTGTYNKIIDKKLISYSMPDGRKVDIEFVQNGNEVVISQTFDIEKTNSDEQQRVGWQAILGNFKHYVESE